MATQEFVLTEEMRQEAIGVQGVPRVVPVAKGDIVRFAEAIEDQNILWNDESVARKSRYGGLIASPTFLRSMRPERPAIPFDIPFTRLLDAGSHWEYSQLVRPGDCITAIACIENISQRMGKLGPMLFVLNAITYSNQFSEIVAIERNSLIRY